MVSVIVVAISVVGYAYGALIQASPKYTGCLSKGVLTSVAIGDAPLAACKKDQTQISWSETGPPGPPGPKGDSASLADVECSRTDGDDGSVVTRIRGDDTVELTCETESGHQSLALTDEVAQVAADFYLTGERDLAVAQDCAGLGFGCSGGQPITPAPTMRMTGLDVFVDEAPHQRRFDVTHALVRVETSQPIPFNFLGAECSLAINSGYKPTRAQLPFVNREEQGSPPNRIEFVNPTFLEGITTEEYTIGGGIGCGLATTITPAVVGQLILISMVAQAEDGLCGAPGPGLFVVCED